MPTAREGNAKAALLKYINHIKIIENYACKQATRTTTTYTPRAPRTRDDHLAVTHLSIMLSRMIHAKHLLNEHGQFGDANPAKLFQFVNGARTAHEHIFGSERKFGRGQRQIAYDLCNALDLAAAMKVRPGETVEQLVAMKELHMRQVIAVSGAAQMYQRHQRHIAHLMLHQRHIELMRLLALVGLDAEHIVGPSMLHNGQQRLQLCADIGAECCGLFAGLSTGIALREEALHQRQFTLMKRCAYILWQHV